MKTVYNVLLSSLILLSFSSIAAKDLHNKLIIQAIPSSEGTVLIKWQPKYEKTFNVVVYSVIDQPIELTGDVGYYKAFNEKGKEFDGQLVLAELLGILKDSPKAGEATFVSDDVSITPNS